MKRRNALSDPLKCDVQSAIILLYYLAFYLTKCILTHYVASTKRIYRWKAVQNQETAQKLHIYMFTTHLNKEECKSHTYIRHLTNGNKLATH